MSRRPLVPSREHAIVLAVATTVAAAVLWWDAYEGRGKGRPFWLKFMPGPV